MSIYPDVAKADRIAQSFQGKKIHSKYAGATCKRCSCIIVMGTEIVWSLRGGGAHIPGDCPPVAIRPMWHEWADTLKAEQRELRRIPCPKPLQALIRLDEIEAELAAGWPGGAA